MTIKELKKGIKNKLKEYKRGSQNHAVVIGVPHKTPKGEKCIKKYNIGKLLIFSDFLLIAVNDDTLIEE